MNATTILIAKLAALGITCGTTGYVARPVVDKVIARVTAPPAKPKDRPPHRGPAKPAHINTKTIPACAVPILPISSITSLSQPLAMMDDDVEDADQVASGALPNYVGRATFGGGRPGGGGFGSPGGSGGGGGTIIGVPKPKPTPTPTTPVAAVPEPSTWMMLLGGLFMTGFALRRTRRAALRKAAI